jgi:L-rhamnose mutarotase
MTRQVLAVDLKDDPAVVAAYTAQHEGVWPEVLHSLQRAGIEEMEIYILGRRLVMIVDTADGVDFRRCFAAHVVSHPRVVEWEALMKGMQEPPPGASAGEWWAVMQPVFRLGDGKARTTPVRQGSVRPG